MASFLRALRPVAVSRTVISVPRSVALRNNAFALQRAWYSASSGLQKTEIEARVLDVLKSFEKVKAEGVATTSRFAEDLGLDSLDAVEVVMAVEEEFAIEIPDAEADEIKTVQQAIDYIAKTPDAK